MPYFSFSRAEPHAITERFPSRTAQLLSQQGVAENLERVTVEPDGPRDELPIGTAWYCAELRKRGVSCQDDPASHTGD
jgi:hypothetical protein